LPPQKDMCSIDKGAVLGIVVYENALGRLLVAYPFFVKKNAELSVWPKRREKSCLLSKRGNLFDYVRGHLRRFAFSTAMSTGVRTKAHTMPTRTRTAASRNV